MRAESFSFFSVRCSWISVVLLCVVIPLFGQQSKEDLLKERSQLLQEIAQLARIGKYSAIISKYETILSLEKKLYGQTDTQVITTLERLSSLHEALNEWDEAKRRAQEITSIQKQLHGKDHWKTQDAERAIQDLDYRQKLSREDRQRLAQATAYFRQAVDLYRRGARKQPLTIAQRAIAIRERILGGKHPDTVAAMSNLATMYLSAGEYTKALKLNEKTIQIRKETIGTHHPEYATSLNNLAGVYHAQGQYHKSLHLVEQALILTKKSQGEKHLDYANSLNNLAGMYSAVGRYQEGFSLIKQSLSLYEELVGKKDPRYVQNLGNLASAYRHLGQYDKSLPLTMQTLTLNKEILGENHPRYAYNLNRLANQYQFQSEYTKALPLSLQALAIHKATMGEQHPDYATSLFNVGVLYKHLKQFDNALSLTTQARSILEKLLGNRHPFSARVLYELAEIYHLKKEYKKALPLYEKALAIEKELFGEQYPLLSTAMNNLANLHREIGEFDKAQSLFTQSLELIKSTLTEQHPSYADGLSNLGFLFFAQRDYELATKYYLQAAKAYLNSRHRISAEGLQRASHSSENSPFSILAVLLAKKGQPEQAWYWLEQSLGRAVWDEVSARQHRTENEQKQLDQLQSVIQQTEQRLQKLASKKSLTDDQQQLKKQWLHEQSQRYERLSQVNQQLQKKYGITEGNPYDLNTIQSVLSDNTAIVTWIDIRNENWAIVLRSKGQPIWERVQGSGKQGTWTEEDARLTEKLYESLRSPRNADSNKYRQFIKQIQRQRIEPIAKYLKNIQHIVILPSTLMDNIPVELLLPEKKVSHAPSATVYAYLRQRLKSKSSKLLALGDPIFHPTESNEENSLPESGVLITSVLRDSLAGKAKLSVNDVLLEYHGHTLTKIDDLRKAMTAAQGEKTVRIKVWQQGRIFQKAIPTGRLGIIVAKEPAKVALQNRRKEQWQLISRGETWNALPGTRVEVASIANLVSKEQRQVFLDSAASEQSLYQLAATDKLKTFRYLHLATHGQVNPYLPMESALILSRDKLKSNVEALKADEPIFDGRLTAKEVARYWQLDADLVALSACNSGLGAHARGEGYMGFAQSFLIRGSRSIVLTLWSVDDTATALLMSRFYENLIKKKMTKINALRKAKNWLRTLSRSEVLQLTAKLSNGVARGPGRKTLPPLSKLPLSEKAEGAPYAHPYYWSSFILIGDPH